MAVIGPIKQQPYVGPENYWIGVMENQYNPTVYQGIQGHVHHTTDTWQFARYIKLFGHYEDYSERQYHIFYEGKKHYPFPFTGDYMTDDEVFYCLLSVMKFHHIWYDQIGFEVSPWGID